MSDDTINIVLTCDDRYAQHAAVTIVSVVKNTKRNVHFYVFDCGILPENLERLKQLDVGSNVLEVIQVQKIDVFENYKYRQCYSPAIMYRLAIPEILPHLDKALYLDSDIIAVRDIGELWDIDLGEKLLGAYDEHELKHKACLEYYANNNLSNDSPYINSGVLLMNLKAMREWHFFEKCLEDARGCSDVFVDQNMINRICGESQVLFLNERFNFSRLASLKEESFLNFQPVLLHVKAFVYPPLFLRCLPEPYKLSYRYYVYLAITPWARQNNKCASWRYALATVVRFLLKKMFCFIFR